MYFHFHYQDEQLKLSLGLVVDNQKYNEMSQLPGKGGERKRMMIMTIVQIQKKYKCGKILNWLSASMIMNVACCCIAARFFKDFSAVRAMAVLAIKHFQENLSVHLYISVKKVSL